MTKVRLDVLMVSRGLAESRSQAQRLIMAGQVRAAGQLVTKPAASVMADATLEVDQGPAYVSRGGEKLAAALARFPVQVDDQICADVGASTGGFTDCLLQHAARRVYAIDVGYGILHWRLRQDSRVVVMERTNARYIERLAEPVQLVTIDASFISLKILLPVVAGWFSPHGGQVIALIKPQFEAGRREAARGNGVIRQPQIHARVLRETLEFAQHAGYSVNGLLRSPLLGPKGNVEFLTWLLHLPSSGLDLVELIRAVLPPID
jgi:23S rRNA (cytidine1920-2'-O)/16S rRNA (cytidine1409-2'-O)-methyltransferase